MVDGFLADRPELEREADVFLKQTSRDKWQYGLSEQIVAAAYAVTGNADRALPLIEKALSISCDSSLTRANLRQHPVWDGVRNDPRFVKLVSGAPN